MSPKHKSTKLNMTKQNESKHKIVVFFKYTVVISCKRRHDTLLQCILKFHLSQNWQVVLLCTMLTNFTHIHNQVNEFIDTNMDYMILFLYLNMIHYVFYILLSIVNWDKTKQCKNNLWPRVWKVTAITRYGSENIRWYQNFWDDAEYSNLMVCHTQCGKPCIHNPFFLFVNRLKYMNKLMYENKYIWSWHRTFGITIRRILI